jgi:hypothetical protein
LGNEQHSSARSLSGLTTYLHSLGQFILQSLLPSPPLIFRANGIAGCQGKLPLGLRSSSVRQPPDWFRGSKWVFYTTAELTVNSLAMIKKSSQELINLNGVMLTLTGNAAFHGPCISVSHGEMAIFYLQPGLTFIFLALI